MAATMLATEADTVLAAPGKAGTVLEGVPTAPVPVAPEGDVAEPGVPRGVEVPEATTGVPVAVDVPIRVELVE